MEQEEFTSDNFNPSPKLMQPFQADKFLRKNNHLNIPDTIPEHSSELTLATNGSIMEAPVNSTEVLINDDKVDISSNQSIRSDASSSVSTIIAVDNSFLVDCERKLLENSCSEDDKSFTSGIKNFKNNNLAIPRKLEFINETISTPPNELRHQINILREEMAETHEFHDLEIQILKEQQCLGEECNQENHLQWSEKYQTLLEMYLTLKNEYEEYRNEQEKAHVELQNKTAACLENICSQIEASDSSLNLSIPSFLSFNTELKSSTMLGNISEVEATVVNDATLQLQDPLSITQDGTFKTPKQTPLRSVRNLFQQQFSSAKRHPATKEDVIREEHTNEDQENHLLNIETSLYDKIKEVEELEQRLVKVEDFSTILQSENERISLTMIKENKSLKELLKKKTEQLDELTQKLVMETTGLNPSIKDSLTEMPGTKILSIFIETIMESCKNVNDEFIKKISNEKTEWESQRNASQSLIENLQNQIKALKDQIETHEASLKNFEDLKNTYDALKKQISEAESIIATRDEEIRLLQSHDNNVRRMREELSSAEENVLNLRSQLTKVEAEKEELELRCRQLEGTGKNVQMNENESSVSSYEKVVLENETLKQLVQQSEQVVANLKADLEAAKKTANETILRDAESVQNEENAADLLKVVEESRKSLLDKLSKAKISFDISCDALLKLISDTLEDPTLKDILTNETTTKFLTLFAESITDCCNYIKGTLTEEFNVEKASWQSEKNSDLILIENLQNQIKTLSEKNNELGSKLSEISVENDHAGKLHATLQEQLSNAEKAATSLKEEINNLESEKANLTKANEELASANERVKQLEARLVSAESEKSEIESRCSKLSETNLSLQTEIKSKETIVKELENSKLFYENGYEEFKRQIEQSSEVIETLKAELNQAREEVSNKELKVQELSKNIELRNNENDNLGNLLQALEESRKTIIDTLSNIQTVDLTDDDVKSKIIFDILEVNPSLKEPTETKILSIFVETVLENCRKVIKKYDEDKVELETRQNNNLILIENLQNQIKALLEKQEARDEEISEYTSLKEMHNALRLQISEAENTISTQNEKLQLLQSHESNLKEATANLALSDETIQQLRSDLVLVETEKQNLEVRLKTLEEGNVTLQTEINAKNDVLRNLQKSNSFYEMVQIENQDLKERIAKSEQLMATLQADLERAKQEQSSNETKVEELTKEIESLKNENGMLPLVRTLEDGKNTLKGALLDGNDVGNDITKWIDKALELNPSLKDTQSTKILSIFTDVITESRKGLQDAFDKQLSSERLQWETQKTANLESLQEQIKALTERNDTYEAKISEINMQRDELKNMYEEVKDKLCKTENDSARNEEIRHAQEIDLKKTKDDLSVAEEAVEKLKTELSSAESHKLKIENENVTLKEMYDALKEQVTKSEGAINNYEQEIEALKSYENEIKQIKESLAMADEEVVNLKAQLASAEAKKVEIENENVNLKNLQDSLKEQIADAEMTISKNEEEIQSLKSYENEIKLAKESLTQTEEAIDKLKEQLTVAEAEKEAMENDKMHFKELYDALKEEMSKTENLLATREEDIQVLKSYEAEIRQNKENLASADEMISKLKDQLSSIEAEKDEIEKEKSRLQELYDALMEKMSEAENLITIRDEEIKILKPQQDELKETKNILVVAEEAVLKLKEQLSLAETEKLEIENDRTRFKEQYDTLKEQMSKADSVISARDEEIQALKSCEEDMKKAQEKLTMADEEIVSLKSQLSYVESEKLELATRCQALEQGNTDLQSEISAKEAVLKELEKSKACYEKLQIENDDLKQKIQESEEVLTAIKSDLNLAKEEQSNNECKFQDLAKEICDLKKQNGGFLEILKVLEKSKKSMADAWADFQVENDSHDRINKLVSNTMELIPQDCSLDGNAAKIISVFIDAIKESCESVQGELQKKFRREKSEWETQKGMDLTLIDNLQNQLKILKESKTKLEENLSEIKTEKDDVRKMYEALKEQVSESESVISGLKEKVESMQSNEERFEQAKEDLATADETIHKLKSLLSSAEAEKVEIENRCFKLEESNLDLQSVINNKDMQLKGLEEYKYLYERLGNENVDLKKQIQELEEVGVGLKVKLEVVEKEQSQKEVKVEGLLKEIERLKKEEDDLARLSEERVKGLEESKKNLTDVLSEIQSSLEMPSDSVSRVLSGSLDSRKVFVERINAVVKAQLEEVKSENKNLKFGNENLKQRVRELSKIISETDSQVKQEISTLNNSQSHGVGVRNKPKMDLCVRRLDKLEEINHNLTVLLTSILTTTEFPNVEKLKFFSVRHFPSINKQIMGHINSLLASKNKELEELKTANAELDEECESYAKVIKDLKKEAAVSWKTNMEKTEVMEAEIARLLGEVKTLENDKQSLLTKIAKLESECLKLRESTINPEGAAHACNCGTDLKKVNDLKRTILIKEQKIMALQDLETQITSYRSQIKYLENALDQEKKKINEERDKNKKLQNELNELTKNQKTAGKKSEENEMLEELRMRGSLSGGVVQEIVDKEKMRKLTKDIGILKELCRARYAEIKRLEAENAALKNSSTPKNLNQMDSPIRVKSYNTRSRNVMKELSSPWNVAANGKENRT